SATSAFRPAPDLPPATPQNLVATGSQSGIALDWDDNTEPDLKGYNIYRSADGSTGWTKLNGSAVAVSQYNDATAPSGAKSYYQVFAIDNADQQSTNPATANADRPADITAPAQPTGFAGSGSHAGIALAWTSD